MQGRVRLCASEVAPGRDRGGGIDVPWHLHRWHVRVTGKANGGAVILQFSIRSPPPARESFSNGPSLVASLSVAPFSYRPPS